MGCCSSGATSGVGLVGSSAKAWLGLEDSPVSIQVEKATEGGKGLNVQVIGIDRYGLISELEAAFGKRNLVVQFSKWYSMRGLINASFSLQEVTASQASEDGSVIDMFHEPAVREHTAQKPYLITATGEGSDIVHTRITFVHTIGPELRAGFLRFIHAIGGNTCQGEYRKCHKNIEASINTGISSQTSYSSSHSPWSPKAKKPFGAMVAKLSSNANVKGIVQEDTFCFDCLQPDLDLVFKGELASAEAFQTHLRQARMLLEEEYEKASRASLPQDEGIYGSESATPRKALSNHSVTSMDFIDSLRHADKLAMRRTLLELPVALRGRVKTVTYRIEPTSYGKCIPGLQKFMGVGTVPQAVGTKEMQVQVSTYFVKEALPAKGKSGIFNLSSLMASQYAEFVNSIDVSKGRFIVEKVFLNSICRPGERYGAHATAEQLWAPIWANESDGKAILPVCKLKEIKFSDVVNWNTYCIMCIAMRADLGESFSFLEDQELKSAKLTRDECISLSTLDVFLRTCLGKFMKHVIGLWAEWSGVNVKCISATASFNQGYETIAGEPRHAMDICIKVSSELAQTVPLDDSGKGTAQQRPVESHLDEPAIHKHGYIKTQSEEGDDAQVEGPATPKSIGGSSPIKCIAIQRERSEYDDLEEDLATPKFHVSGHSRCLFIAKPEPIGEEQDDQFKVGA